MTSSVPPRRAILFAAATLLAFVIGGVIWFPASLAVRALPAPYTCTTPTGSLWHGRCGTLRVGDASIGTVSWRLRGLPLFGARFVADVDWSRSGSQLAGVVDVSAAIVSVRDLRGTADLATLRALPVWPPALLESWSPGEGRLRVDLKAAEMRDRRLVRVEGRLDVDGLVTVGRERWMLGDYRLVWIDGPTPVGRLTDRGGPLELVAELRAVGDTGPPDAQSAGAWRLEGTVRARDPAWRSRLMFLGPADGTGRHALSIEWR